MSDPSDNQTTLFGGPSGPCAVCAAQFDERCLAKPGEHCPQQWREKGPRPAPQASVPHLIVCEACQSEIRGSYKVTGDDCYLCEECADAE